MKARTKELRDSLLREFATRRESQDQRIAWLAAQVAEYVDRWRGFCELPDVGIHALLNNDLFLMIEIGSKLLQQHVMEERHAEREAVRRLTSAVEACRRVATRREIQTLLETAEAMADIFRGREPK